MAGSQDSFSKRERQKQKAREKQEKRQKMADRKLAGKSKSAKDEIAYVDDEGNLTSIPPDPSKKRVFELEDIEIGVPQQLEEKGAKKEGSVNFFNPVKGFGFIRDARTGNDVFFHQNNIAFPIQEGDRLSFDTERGEKGLVAVNIEKL